MVYGDSDGDRAEAGAYPADKVHEAGGGAATRRMKDVVERGRQAGIVDPFAEPVESHRGHEPPEIAGVPAKKNKWRPAQDRQRLNLDTAIGAPTYAAIRSHPAEHRAGHACRLNEERGSQARRG